MHRLLFVAPLLVAACAGQGVGPSLSKRPIESQSLAEPQVQAQIAPPADAGLLETIETLRGQVRAGQSAFAALLPGAQAAAASAGAEASESWIAAQQQLSALEAARAPSTRALGELDALMTARIGADTDAGLAEVQAAQTEAGTIVDEQQRAIDALRERISR